MNFRSALTSLIMLTALDAAVLRAQLIHIGFTDPDNFVILQSTSASLPWDIALGEMTRLDLYYDPTAAFDAGDGRFEFSDSSHAFWQARVAVDSLGTLVISRPLAFLQVDPTSLSFEDVIETPDLGLEEFAFFASFAGVISPDGKLPTTAPLPPLLLGENGDNLMFFLQGSGTLFELPGLVDTYGIGGFEQATLYPIPEPSAYAFGALGLLGIAVIVRRTRAPRPA